MKYTATIEEKPDGGIVIAFAVKCSKQDLSEMLAACEFKDELSLRHLRDRYQNGPASTFVQAVAQFIFWGELR